MTVTQTVGARLSLSEALREAGDGSTVLVPAGDYHGQVAVITQRRLTLRGTGGRPVLHAGGRAAERKAILVVRGGDVLIENIEFRGARVADRNGAGIRFETGRLRVASCRFFDNENGILAGNDSNAELDIDDCDFGGAPAATPLPHLLYVGRIARFVLTGSRLGGGRDGHLLKSRARLSLVLHNRLIDGPGGAAAYELEFPNGGTAWVVGNVVGQSSTTSNPTMVSFGAEGSDGLDGRAHGLYLVHNTLFNDSDRPARFVRVHRLPGPLERLTVNNRFVGPGAADGVDDGLESRNVFERRPPSAADRDGPPGLPGARRPP